MPRNILMHMSCFRDSLRLAAHLLSDPTILARRGLRILELGSGSGLLGTVLAKEAKDAQVFLTDREGVVLDRLHETVEESQWGTVKGASPQMTQLTHLFLHPLHQTSPVLLRFRSWHWIGWTWRNLLLLRFDSCATSSRI
jgi:hypothetical protein